MSNSGLVGQEYQFLKTGYVERLIIELNFRKNKPERKPTTVWQKKRTRSKARKEKKLKEGGANKL